MLDAIHREYSLQGVVFIGYFLFATHTHWIRYIVSLCYLDWLRDVDCVVVLLLEIIRVSLWFYEKSNLGDIICVCRRLAMVSVKNTGTFIFGRVSADDKQWLEQKHQHKNAMSGKTNR